MYRPHRFIGGNSAQGGYLYNCSCLAFKYLVDFDGSDRIQIRVSSIPESAVSEYFSFKYRCGFCNEFW